MDHMEHDHFAHAGMAESMDGPIPHPTHGRGMTSVYALVPSDVVLFQDVVYVFRHKLLHRQRIATRHKVACAAQCICNLSSMGVHFRA